MTDSYVNLNVLHLHCEGADASTTVIDSSISPHTPVCAGNAKIATAQAKFGSSSLYFPGTSSDYVFIPASNYLNLNDYADVTIEFWCYPTTLTATLFCMMSALNASMQGGFAFYANNANTRFQFTTSAGDAYNGNAPSAMTANQWNHIALVCLNKTWTCYLNGVGGTPFTTDSRPYWTNNYNFCLGRSGNNSTPYPFTGYLDEIRFTKGVARYTANFTPATAAFDDITDTRTEWDYSVILHHCNDPLDERFHSVSLATATMVVSATQSKFGTASFYFDGTGYVIITGGAELLLDRDFTIEFWCYPTYADANLPLLYSSIYFSNTGVTVPDGGPVINFGSFLTSTLNMWQHVAFVRKGATYYLFRNGILQSSRLAAAFNNSFVFNLSHLELGHDFSYYKGYIDELRIMNGYGKYTATFTPDAAAFTSPDRGAITGSQTPRVPLQIAPGAVSGYPSGKLRSGNSPVPFSPGKVSGYPTGKLRPMRTKNCDMYDGGHYIVDGTVTFSGSPASRKVRLSLLNNGRVLREMWSDPITGYYCFADLKNQPYYVWSEDYLQVYDPVSHLTTLRA